MATTTTTTIDTQVVPGIGRVVTKCQTIIVHAEDFEAAATSDTVSGAAIAVCWPVASFSRLVEKFAAPTASDAQLIFGDSGDADGLHAARDVHDSGTLGTVVGTGADITAGTYHATYTPVVTLTLTDDNCEDLTAGIVALDFVYRTVEAV